MTKFTSNPSYNALVSIKADIWAFSFLEEGYSCLLQKYRLLRMCRHGNGTRFSTCSHITKPTLSTDAVLGNMKL